MKKPSLKPLFKPVRELIRSSPSANESWLALLAKLRSERGRVGKEIASIGDSLAQGAIQIQYVGGEIGTTTARLTWHYPAVPERGFEVELSSPLNRTLSCREPGLTVDGLEPHTVYRGIIRSLDTRHCEAPFSFWTRPAGVTGYVLPLSASPGSEVDLFVSSEDPEVSVTLRPLLHTDCPVASWKVDARYQFAPMNASGEGCRWMRTLTMPLPADIASGVYIVHLECAADGSEFLAPLIVRPETVPEVALVSATNTWSAYNDWGGNSLYDNRIDAPEPLWVTQARPNYMAHPFGKGTFHLLGAEWHMHRHLERHGVSYGTYTDDDLAEGRLRGCRTLVLSGHNEYWSEAMLSEFDRLAAAGVNVICMSGNTMFRRIVPEATRHAFSRTAFYQPDEVSPRLGSIYDARGRETAAPYVVVMPDHWIFEGTGACQGQEFGAYVHPGLSASGIETDKRTPFSPPNAQVVARGANPGDGGAEFLVFERGDGSLVVNAGSITVAINLDDPMLDRMIANVYRRLRLQGASA